MNSILRTLLIAAAPGGLALSEEIRKPDAANGPAKIEVGPVSVAVSVVSSSDGAGSKSPYLGVVTSPVPPQLRAQLDLPEGMGLSVDAVAAGSPAEQAGIRQFDVLKKFNDQMLCTQDQLAVLVKSAGKGGKADLTVLRGGKEQKITATIGEHDAPEGGKAGITINGMPGINIEVGDIEKLLKESFGGNGDVKTFSFTLPGGVGGGGGAVAGGGGIQKNMDDVKKKMEGAQKDIQQQIDAAIKKAQEAAKNAGAAQAKAFSIYPGGASSQSMVSVTDNEGTIEITDANGVRSVKIKDAAGKEIHAGPLNNQADRDAVPEQFRAKVKDAESKIKTSNVGGGIKKKTEKKVEQQKKVEAGI